MLSAVLASLTRPSELTALLKYKFSPNSGNKAKHQHALAVSDDSKRQCYEFLEMTSRSFASVIQELDDELRDVVCLFYLVLRGLDTIEDDMTLDLQRKEGLLRTFSTVLEQKGWVFTENDLKEKDRELLVHFDVVIEEFSHLKPNFKKVIASVAKEMGNGMADYATGEHRENTSIKTVEDYDRYCHYVAGLVGYGLSDLFAESGLEAPEINSDKKLSNSMGLFLQKTNIIRDYREDLDDGRQFWPHEIWGKYCENFGDFTRPENKEKALACSSDMVLNSLNHVPDVLTYLSKLKNNSVFNFCAIPQVMAISTLALVFNNLDIYQRNIKIRKGEAVQLIMESTDMDKVVSIFRHYIKIISQKNDPVDPHFMEISIAVGKIEQWITANVGPSQKVASWSIVSFLPFFFGFLGALLYNIINK